MPHPRVAFLGLGTMGLPMASRLLAAGFPLTVWNRTPAPAQTLASRGAQVASSPAGAARDAELVLTMLGDPAAVAAVALGPDGILEGLAPGTLLCDFSTVDPATSRRLGAACRAVGAGFVDAPVYGSKKPAEQGALVILAGGAAEDLQRLDPVLAVLGRRVFHAGPVGCGSAMKLSINAVGPHMLVGLAFGIHLAQGLGLDGAQFLEALGAGAFASPLVQLKGPGMLRRDYPPAFSVDLMAKDLGLVLAEAKELGVDTRSVQALLALYCEAQARGLGRQDLAAVAEVVAPVTSAG